MNQPNDPKPALNPEVSKDLFEGLALELAARLHEGECDKCGRSKCSVQELEVIRKFLSDNGITQFARAGTPIRRLLDNPPFPVKDPEAESPGAIRAKLHSA